MGRNVGDGIGLPGGRGVEKAKREVTPNPTNAEKMNSQADDAQKLLFRNSRRSRALFFPLSKSQFLRPSPGAARYFWLQDDAYVVALSIGTSPGMAIDTELRCFIFIFIFLFFLLCLG
ncbi:hypothetical protein BO70DRAFT_138568 [Aspergillus heteromorphus CBS 117.55]|uniref:Uncharacterized protein n=1 Tax=Aspergillus heteromorphus CBS 117.55 TaxID=1448321 RepID=A0A317V7V6_9EURO|nr:uncharacterized protein BO70DRAFT_138568 [Aspergillus heteromorphus CBS 117.55]PWY70443.1 hypothetical protein BO70DRAFT_138568 [Aspergillus heteromorphus CBS 117.55]